LGECVHHGPFPGGNAIDVESLQTLEVGPGTYRPVAAGLSWQITRNNGFDDPLNRFGAAIVVSIQDRNQPIPGGGFAEISVNSLFFDSQEEFRTDFGGFGSFTVAERALLGVRVRIAPLPCTDIALAGLIEFDRLE
jgi:hypothetical protein